MQVSLLNVAHSARESQTLEVSRNMLFSADNPGRRAICENVEQCGFTSSRCSLDFVSQASCVLFVKNDHTIKAVMVRGFTHPSMPSRMRLSVFPTFISYVKFFHTKVAASLSIMWPAS